MYLNFFYISCLEKYTEQVSAHADGLTRRDGSRPVDHRAVHKAINSGCDDDQ